MPFPCSGQFVKDADPDLIAELTASGRLEEIEPYTHSYPHCWRCGTALIYWAKPTWFAHGRHSDELLRENETIGWHPEHIKHGRFGDWLENNVDWALSRDRYWGTPMPVWRCGDCGDDQCMARSPSLSSCGRDLADLDLHRPYVDDIMIPCTECGGAAASSSRCSTRGSTPGRCRRRSSTTRSRTPSSSSAASPPTSSARPIDQTRGWFYSLLAVNTLVFGAAPYRNVVCLAHIVDRRGEDVEVQGQRHRPVDGPRFRRRRRAALVLLLGRLAVDDAPCSETASTSRRAGSC